MKTQAKKRKWIPVVIRNQVQILMTYSFVGVEMVTLVIGPETLCATVPKQILCDKSAYFQRAFAPDFKEGQNNEIVMPEDKPEVVDAFLSWAFGQEVSALSLWDWGRKASGRGQSNISFLESQATKALELYFFSDRCQVIALSQRLITAFYNYSQYDVPPSIDNFMLVCNNTPSTSGL